MYKGFYNLTSSMLTQNKTLNVISNNITNVSTAGFKSDMTVQTTFEEELLMRTGHNYGENTTNIGGISKATFVDDVYTNYQQGAFNDTYRSLDFALDGAGFFTIEPYAEGEENIYTRNGSFILDDDGYLALSSVGRVVGEAGPIQLLTDKIQVNSNGDISGEDGEILASITITDFENYDEIIKSDEGHFTNPQGVNEIDSENTTVSNLKLERSNVDSTVEMTNMMVTQRLIQSGSQLIKMYDELMAKGNEIGKI